MKRPPYLRAWRSLELALPAAIIAGVIAGIADPGLAGGLLAATVAIVVASRTAIAIAAYRRTMAADWPAVAPITDWED